jgi:hypothetical protein
MKALHKELFTLLLDEQPGQPLTSKGLIHQALAQPHLFCGNMDKSVEKWDRVKKIIIELNK